MPIVIKSSHNGSVDPKSKTIRLPDYLIPKSPRLQALRKAATAAIPLAILTLSSLPAQATVVNLADGNASATFNTSNGTGLNSLLVNGTQQVISQWFDYRLGAGPGAAVPIDSANNGVTQTFISLPGIGVNSPGVSFNGTSNFFSVTYGSTSNSVPFDYTVKYTLTGGAPNAASISENVAINDDSKTTALPISFFEYNHFNLNNQAHDNVVIGGGPPINTATQTSVTTGATNIETAATPPPSFYQAATGTTLATEFASAAFTNLPNTPTAGPGDASWAFEWNPTIAASGSFQISKVRTITVPEPATASVTLGAISLLAIRRPRKSQPE